MKRKNRWIFEGRNKDGEIVFPKGFVKMLFVEKNLIEEFVGKNFGMAQFFTMYDEKDNKATEEFEKFNKNYCNVISGVLELLDGCGNILEKWTVENITMELSPNSIIEEDYIVANWCVYYGEINLITSMTRGEQLAYFNEILKTKGQEIRRNCGFEESDNKERVTGRVFQDLCIGSCFAELDCDTMEVKYIRTWY